MTRFINEGRMGEPKTFKTGAVVGTYPKPLLYIGLDQGGLDVLPDRGEKPPTTKDWIKLDVTLDDVVAVALDQFDAACQTKDQPPITSLDFFSDRVGNLTDLYQPTPYGTGFASFVKVINTLRALDVCPWRTVVVDPITGLSDLIGSHLASVDKALFKDARKWTPAIGYQIAKVIANLGLLKAHRVFVFHAQTVINESGSITGIRPMIPSQYGRDRVGGLLAQTFYALKENGVPKVLTTDRGHVKGIGCRWPRGLPQVCGPAYKDIYGTTP